MLSWLWGSSSSEENNQTHLLNGINSSDSPSQDTNNINHNNNAIIHSQSHYEEKFDYNNSTFNDPNQPNNNNNSIPDKTDNAKFPPMFVFPPWQVILGVILLGVAFALCATVFQSRLSDMGVSTMDILQYGSIPIVSILFTYCHIWLALWMTFYPIKFFGIWQMPGTNMVSRFINTMKLECIWVIIIIILTLIKSVILNMCSIGFGLARNCCF